MAAGFRAFGDDGIGPQLLHAPGQSHAGHHGQHPDARFLPGLHIGAGVACACGDDGHFFLNDQLGHLICLGMHQHDIDAEGLIRHRFTGAYFAAHPVGVRVHGGNDAEAARVGNGARERRVRDPRHAALDNGVLDMK